MQGNTVTFVNREAETAYDWCNPLLTDMYQIKMTYAEWKAKRHDEQCVFEMFFRKLPFKGNFAIMAGMDEVLRFLESYKFSEEHINYLRSVITQCEDEFWEYLRNLDCKGIKVSGAIDGEMVFPDQPLLRLEGPFSLL